MKAFIISILAILIALLLVILNCVYIVSVSSELEKLARELEFDDYESLVEFEEYWQRHYFFICLSSVHEKTDKIEECIAVLKDKYLFMEEDGFFEYRSLLLHYIDEIKKVQELSVDTIV